MWKRLRIIALIMQYIILLPWPFSVLITWEREKTGAMFSDKKITCFMSFLVAHVKCVNVLPFLANILLLRIHMTVLNHHGLFYALFQLLATWFSFSFISKSQMKWNFKKIDERKKELLAWNCNMSWNNI